MMPTAMVAEGATRSIVRTLRFAELENLTSNNATSGTPFEGCDSAHERFTRRDSIRLTHQKTLPSNPSKPYST